MLERMIKCCAWILMLSVVLAAAPALAGDASDLAGRAATWEKAYNAGNFNAVAALYAADGCRMPPNAKTAQGSQGILAQLKAARKQGAAKVKIAVTTGETSGDFAYGMGTYDILGTDGTRVDHGKWMNVSKMLKGTWKIQCDIWNSDIPMPAKKAK